MDFGFSKDCKSKEVQVMLALVTTTDGLPITYRAFPGNMYEGHTLIDMVRELKAEYEIENIVLVADRAMFNEKNLKAMEDENVNYVVAAKLKGLDKKAKTEVLEGIDYQASVVCDELHWLKEFTYKSRRVIVRMRFLPSRIKKPRSSIVNACMECGACMINCEVAAITLNPGVGCAAYIISGWINRKENACCC